MKVPRRSLLALAVGFLFPGFRPDSTPEPETPPELRLTKKPDDLYPPSAFHINGRLIPEYICPIHGDIGTNVLCVHPGDHPAVKPQPPDVFCFHCMCDQLKKLPIAQLGD